MSVLIALATIVLFVAFPEALISVFLDPEDPARSEIIAAGVILLILAALFQLVDGAQIVALGLLRGVQDTRGPMILAAIAYFGVGLPAAYILGFPMGWGGAGVWTGLVIGLAAAAGLLSHRFWFRTIPGLTRLAAQGTTA
jgi:multidrug resistance protein, MATE family